MPRGVRRVAPPDADVKSDGLTAIERHIQTRKDLETIDPKFRELPLAQKLGLIMGLIGNVPKTGYNSFHKYRYTTEMDLVAAVRPYLAAAGIIIIPSVYQHEHVDDLTTLTVQFKITDGSTTENLLVVGYGSDKGDKGAYKAMTGATKYMLMKLFLIDTGDDPESDTRTDQRAAQQDVREIKIEDHREPGVRRGGHPAKSTDTQYRRIVEAVRLKGISRDDLIGLINELKDEHLDGLEPDADSGEIQNYLQNLPSDAAGSLLGTLEAIE